MKQNFKYLTIVVFAIALMIVVVVSINNRNKEISNHEQQNHVLQVNQIKMQEELDLKTLLLDKSKVARQKLEKENIKLKKQIEVKKIAKAKARVAARLATLPTVSAHYTPSVGNSVWDRLAQCEASGNWSINTGNGYYGGLQFDLPSWRAAGGSGLPSQASREEQIKRGTIWQARSGWGAWPACSAKLGL